MDRYNQERQVLSEKRRQSVIDISEGVFLEKGLNNTSMSDIMKAAEVSKGTLYKYFDNIDQLIFEIEYKMLRRIFKNPFGEPEEGVSLNEYMVTGINTMINEFHDNVDAHCLIAMFDNMYTKAYPNKEMAHDYNEFLINLSQNTFSVEEDMKVEIVAKVNIVLSFLQRLAIRGDLLEKNQGVTVDEQLDVLKKMMEREFSYE